MLCGPGHADRTFHVGACSGQGHDHPPSKQLHPCAGTEVPACPQHSSLGGQPARSPVKKCKCTRDAKPHMDVSAIARHGPVKFGVVGIFSVMQEL